MKKLIFSVCLLSAVFISGLMGQSLTTSYAVLFRSGPEVFPENVQAFIQTPNIDRKEMYQGRIYRLIQFYTIPSLSQRQQLEQKGWVFESYLPHNAYIVSFPVVSQWDWLTAFPIRSIAPIERHHKLHPELLNHNVPPHAFRENMVVLNALKSSQMPMRLLRQQLEQAGATIEGVYPRADMVEFLLPLARLDQVASLNSIQYLDFIPEPGEPEGLRQQSLHRANVIQANYPGAPNFDGSGVGVLVRDDGTVGPHIDFQGRLNQTFAVDESANETHGDRVASVIGGAGNLDPSVQGMAPGASVHVLDYLVFSTGPNFQDSTIYLHRNEGVMITNSSYSDVCNDGYKLTTRAVDDQAYANPTLLHVFSAGNSGTSNCGYGAGNTWGNVTGGHKIGKNVITTASLNVVGTVVNSSSRGPSEDGRIKPDISAMGSNVIMTTPENAYTVSSGTSFSAPAIAGISAQLYQAYREFNAGADPKAALIKAAILNSAEDIGNPGPDYIHGFGLVHAGRALDILEGTQYTTGTSFPDSVLSHSVNVPAGVKEARIMLYWPERASSVLSSKVLINDLDIRVNTPAAGQVLPLVLDPTPNASTLDMPAVPGIDTLNNVEQVVLLDPAAGMYTVEVDGKSVPDGTQEYFILYTFLYDSIELTYPIGGESLVPGQDERIRWDAYGSGTALGNFTLEFSDNGGNSWSTIATEPSDSRSFTWTVPNSITEQARIRITRNGISDMGQDNFHIIGQPENLNITEVCPDALTFSWQSVPGAIAYDVFLLGEKYMDSVDRVMAPQLSATIPITDPDGEYWVSVRAVGPNGLIGRRAVAIGHDGGRINCLIQDDVFIHDASTSVSGPFQSCFSNETQFTVEVTNYSPAVLSNVPIFYQYGQEAVVSDTISGPLGPGTTLTHTFSQLQDLGDVGTKALQIWTAFSTDTLPYNDTTYLMIEVVGSEIFLAHNEDFEDFDLCGISANCEQEVCDLQNGWTNLTNGEQDDIDWRVNQGNTPSGGTGPSQDHRPGNDLGKYLYLEASGGCEDLVAHLISPCIDLSAASQPELSFWYHMEGENMGELHLDILSTNSNGTWIDDIMTPVIGDRGDSWINVSVDLTPYVGSSVTLRFRGITGDGFRSDIAIDDINVVDNMGPPGIDFEADFTEVCAGQIVNFTEMSFNQANAFEWTFIPNLVSFENGTSETSANPSVSFLQPGSYAVQLIASNANGSDSVIRYSYIEATQGTGLDIVENFETSDIPTAHWRAENPDGEFTWERILTGGLGSIGGLSSTLSNVAMLEISTAGTFFTSEDYLVSQTINLAGADKPWLIFDLSFAQASAITSDELRVEVSTDCGNTYSLLYTLSDTNLATVPFFASEWFPLDESHWRRDSVDLSAFVDKSILIRFNGVNHVGQSNNLFLDNIQVRELGDGLPVANISSDVSIACEGETFAFSHTSSGDSITTYNWDFGQDATPSNATTAGPHMVSYSSPGIKTVFLSVSDGGDTVTTSSRVIQVEPGPQASYAVNVLGLTFTFSNQSQNATSYVWDFGDGNTSTEANPVHTYTDFDQYDVSLIATGPCGMDTFSLQLVSIEDIELGTSVQVYPNPTSGTFSVELQDPLLRAWEIRLLDMHGRQIQELSFDLDGATQIARCNTHNLPDGMYLVQLKSGTSIIYKKVMVVK